MKIHPAKNLHGTLTLNGDKSISHRAAMLAALATGETVISNFSTSADCASTLQCLQELGVGITRRESEVIIEGVGKNGLRAPLSNLDCGNSGTTMRLLTVILAGQSFTSVLTGDDSLSKRPMQRIIEPLRQMGAKIEAAANCAPLAVSGKNPLQAVTYKMPKASAQVKSSILLAGLNAENRTKVQSPPSTARVSPTRNHTELMLHYLGANIVENFIESGDEFIHEVSIESNSELTARPLDVPADISAAAFFLVAAACLPDSEIILPNVGLNPTRTAILDVLQNSGVSLEILDRREISNEWRGNLRVCGTPNLAPKSKNANILRGAVIANLIDELPILAVFGTQIEGGLEIRDAEELRVKESDRIRAVVENLQKMGAEV